MFPPGVDTPNLNRGPRAGPLPHMMAMIEFDYNRKFSPEEQLALNQAAINPSGTPITFKEDGCIVEYYHPLAMHIEDAARFGAFKVLRAVERRAAPEIPSPAPCPPFNEKCGVAVPGLGLLLIDDVMLATNHCTDSLRALLDEGWRILAICPQPDQRRPDYVLGRSKK